MKRYLSAVLALIMISSILVNISTTVNAASQLSATPYPNVEYGYSSEVKTGTIRYIAQNRGSAYFSWNYWPTGSFGGYTGGPEIECGTACISMALSYVGVNRTPKALLEATNGYTSAMWGKQDSAASKSINISKAGIATAMDDYINGNGKYSPVLIYIQPFSATSNAHWVLLSGKTGDNQYIALNPWHTAGTNGTLLVQINGSTATYNGTTNPITSVNQWYNPNATEAVCTHSYTSSVTVQPSCTAEGEKTYICSKCGDSYTESIPTNGEHDYGVWQTVTEAGCVTEGLQTRVCACGDMQEQSVPILGHSYEAIVIPGTCMDYEKIRYTCESCGVYYEEYAGADWSEIKPSGVPEDQVETKTQYRYSDFITTQSYTPDLEGYELVDSEWMETETGSIKYVKSCPSGFDTTNNVYSQYNNSPKTNAESNTEKVTVNSEEVSGYIYWHWCRGTYTNGPIDRKTSEYWTSQFNTFHAFFSTTSPDGMFTVGDGSVTYPNGDCCKDSHWYYHIPVYTQSYTSYEKLFTYGQWGTWSDWSETEYTATDTRKVEKRTVYRYISGEFAECTWDEGVITMEPTCTSAGEKTYACTVCCDTKTESIAATGHVYQDGYCSKCSAEDPDYNFVTAKVQIGTVSGEPGDTVTVPVSITDNPGIAGFTFVFDYDASALTLTGISKGAVLQDGSFTPNVAGKTLNWFNAVNTTENGILFSLTFKMSASASVNDYSVTAMLKDGKNTNFVNENAKAQRVIFEAGEISVQETVNLSKIEFASLPAKTTYEVGGKLNTTGLKLKITYSDGSTKTVADGYMISGFDSTTVGSKTVTVTYEGVSTTFIVTITAPKPEIDENAPQIVIKSKKVAAGKEFTVTAEVKNNPGFSYLEVTPVYSSELTLVKVENGDLVSDFTKGKQYVWLADEDVTEDGLLLTFTFKTAEDVEPGNYQVSFKVRTCANYDEEAVALSVADATVEVIEVAYGDVTGDGKIDGFDVIRLKKYLANYDYDTETSTVEVTAGADATGDGKVDGFDVIRLKKYLANFDYETGESTIVLGPQ